MAVCQDSNPDNACLVLERFELASLNRLLYKSQIAMNLPKRVHCLLDVAEGMTYLHNHSIVHGFLNSYSVLITEKFRAKISSLEYSQENGEQKYDNACSINENWMAPEQLLHEPPNMTGDTYRSVYTVNGSDLESFTRNENARKAIEKRLFLHASTENTTVTPAHCKDLSKKICGIYFLDPSFKCVL